MLPVITLVGRPNVGKSTLFNRLTHSRDALVADFAGLTRDRHYGLGKKASRPYLVVDTGGFFPDMQEGMEGAIALQTKIAIQEANAVIFLVDGRSGLTPQDQEIAEFLRQTPSPVLLAINKTEGITFAKLETDFYQLGFKELFHISSAHGQGIQHLVESALSHCPAIESVEEASSVPKIAIVGRPNVGKSTLVNTLLGEDRVIIFDEPGTTRDSIYLNWQKENKSYVLIDTAGIRKRSRVSTVVEKFSVIKTIKAIETANVVVLMIDGIEGVTEQDLRIASYILDFGRSVIIAINKWDGLAQAKREIVKQGMHRQLQFLDFAHFHYISALKRTGITELLSSIDLSYQSAMMKFPTQQLTRIMKEAVVQHQPPIVRGIRPKLRYAHQGGNNPPIIVIHGNHLEEISADYKRYLMRIFQKAFQLFGTPLKLKLQENANPYDLKKEQPQKTGLVTMRKRKRQMRLERASKKTN